jgi:hypothetical protein
MYDGDAGDCGISVPDNEATLNRYTGKLTISNDLAVAPTLPAYHIDMIVHSTEAMDGLSGQMTDHYGRR